LTGLPNGSKAEPNRLSGEGGGGKMNYSSLEIEIEEGLAVFIRKLFNDPNFFDRLSEVERRRFEAEMDSALSGLAFRLTK
jgi:hypothetical protein